MIVCLDTNFIVYLIEPHPLWSPKAVARLAASTTAGDTVAVCDAAILECLIHPLASGDVALEAKYRTLFATPGMRLLPVSRVTWEQAARIGARDNFKPMDSLHLATAVEHGCGLFLTADGRLGRCTAIPVEVLT